MRSVRHRTAAFVLALALGAPALAACGGNEETPEAAAAADLQEALVDQLAGRTAEAKKAYEDILADQPGNKVALYNLGLIAQNAGDLVEAEAKYRAAIAQDAAYTPALFNLAIIRTSQGGAEGKQEAIDLYRKVIAATPNDAASHLNIAFLFLETGDDAAAQREFRLAVKLDPSLASRISRDQSPVGTAPSTSGGSAGAASPAPSPS